MAQLATLRSLLHTDIELKLSAATVMKGPAVMNGLHGEDIRRRPFGVTAHPCPNVLKASDGTRFRARVQSVRD